MPTPKGYNHGWEYLFVDINILTKFLFIIYKFYIALKKTQKAKEMNKSKLTTTLKLSRLMRAGLRINVKKWKTA